MKNIIPEIISPAGNLEKLKFAVKFGADGVYFGGEKLNLRAKAGNFPIEDIEKAVDFCREKKVKTVFLMNSFLHEDDIPSAKEYISQIKNFAFDSIMISDPGMISLLKDANVESDINLSTQMSTLNHLSLKFWTDSGIKRIVLGREATLDEIKKIKDNTNAEIEVFIHGALCVAYSGRCLLSRYLTGRDGNQGDCAQSCRWNYSLIEKMRPGNYLDIVEHATGTEILSSKDLCLIEKVEGYANAGVNAFKIEGRMKSLYYAANTTRIYKHSVNESNTGNFKNNIDFWNNELDLVSHRPYTDNLFNEFNNMGFEPIPYVTKAQFMGYKSSIGKSKEIEVKTFNPIYIGDKLEGIFPIDKEIIDDTFIVSKIVNSDDKPVEMARPGEISQITFDKDIEDNAIFRKRI